MANTPKTVIVTGSALAFKIANDPHVGNLTFFRVYSGVLQSGDRVFNPLGSRPLRSRFDGWLDGEGPD